MECNKEEAIRAKGIAEKKMESKDFAGARKIAIKAQRLYPEVENISQMICVCDVHCSAESKKVGSEKDWYDILKLEQSADEVSIKKQYRKLALLLHPDKNKFGGADTAFLLIGEAQKVLLDKEKRTNYDARYRRCSQSTAANPPLANKNANNVKPPSGQTNMTKNTSSHVKKPQSQPQSQANTGVSGESETFCTTCPFCEITYRYMKVALNQSVACQTCKKKFVAYDMRVEPTNLQSNAKQTATGKSQVNSDKPPSGSNAKQTATHAQGGVSNQGGSCSASNGKFQGNSAQQNLGKDSSAKSRQSTQAGRSKETNELNMGAKYINRTTAGGSTNHSKPNIEKGEKKQVGQPEGSFQSKGGIGSKKEAVEKESGAVAGSGRGDDSSIRQQRSSLSKRNASDSEIGSDDGTLNSPKRFKANAQSSSPTKQTSPAKGGSSTKIKPPGFADKNAKEIPNENVRVKENTPQRSRKVDNNAKGKLDENDRVKENSLPSGSKSGESESSKNPITAKLEQDVPDSDFSDFDQIREENNFKVGQLWAVFDTVDAMPRYYAQIKKIFSSGFKLRITWLEPDPDEMDALEWAVNDMPVSCGKFKATSSENTEDRFMFSHPMCWEKGPGKKGSIMIHPKKDETWAVFRDWHRDWLSNLQQVHSKYEYEFVVILSDYDESVGVRVAFLGKVKGFSCLFCQKGTEEIQIPPNEYHRFSHRVPSNRMTGEEREDVPRGSFELDPASISLNLEEMPLPEEMKPGMAADPSPVSGVGSQGGNPGVVVKENVSGCQNDPMDIHDKNPSTSSDVVEHATTESSSLEACEVPEPEFFKFDDTRVLGMFQVGQVWALYSEAGSLPNFYCLIKKVDKDSEKKLRVAWLEGSSPPNDLIRWKNREMPFTCGKFKIRNRKLQTFLDPSPFSHQLREYTLKSKVFEIYPRKGETWGMFKHWNVDMQLSDLETCDYDFVEILEESVKGSPTKVLALEKVPGYYSVFKAKTSGRSLCTMEIPYKELLRFSHQIPAHDLTEEKDGSLRGFKELDPLALPASFQPKLR